MGSVGDGWRTTTRMCESFFATLECELLDRCRFKDTDSKHVVQIFFEFIEGFYNPRRRRHSSIGYLSPSRRYERRHHAAAVNPNAHKPAVAVLAAVKDKPWAASSRGPSLTCHCGARQAARASCGSGRKQWLLPGAEPKNVSENRRPTCRQVRSSDPKTRSALHETGVSL